MSQKLKEHLARCGDHALRPLLGEQVVDLLRHVGPEALAPEVMANIIITSQGASEVLCNVVARALLIERLNSDETYNLCAVLGLPTDAPRLTLSHVNFDLPNKREQLLSWYNVVFEVEGVDAELSRNISAPGVLSLFQEPAYRRMLGLLRQPRTRMLVHMPFGAGKLRAVVTAVLETFRSEAEGKSILWLAPDDCLCEDALEELEVVWRQLGLRDVTSYRVFGGRGALPMDVVRNSIVVANANEFSKAMADPDAEATVSSSLEKFGNALRCVVLSDAEHVLIPGVAKALHALAEGADWSLIGISASPELAIRANANPDDLLASYQQNVVELTADNPFDALRQAGLVDPINVVQVVSPVTSLPLSDSSIVLSVEMVKILEENLERSKVLLDLLHTLAQDGHRIVFYATSARQARTFAGVLPLRGTSAAAVTGDLNVNARQQEISRFAAHAHSQVLCVHGVLVSSSQTPGVTACVLALPALSSAVIHEMVGRLATGRAAPASPLQVHAIRDPVPEYLRVIDALQHWDRLRT